ncbi:fimbrial protein [Serratia aquatilis]|uniref:Fimbrial protein n=1 Tax=Serratia aquatilis TaxID=1737515 RepID=A0ABV6EKP4_9GAMM
MSRSLIYKFTLFLMVSLGASFAAQALECYKNGTNETNGVVRESVSIGPVKIPANVPIGTRLWTSERISIQAYCWAYPNVPDGEKVYFHPSQYINQPRLPPGIGIGFIDQNGIDRGTIEQLGQLDIESGNYAYVGENNPLNGLRTFTFQVYLRKTADIAIGPVGIDQIAAFQLDGFYGINAKPNVNYQYILTDLSNIEIIPCAASIEINPPAGVDFGEIRAWSAGDGKVAEKDFSIVATKNGSCDGGFKLNANFELKADGHSSLADETGINIGNGATLRITDNTNPKSIKFNKIDSFTDMTSQSVVSKNYTASLWANGEGVEGPFNTTLILRVNYL